MKPKIGWTVHSFIHSFIHIRLLTPLVKTLERTQYTVM